LEAEFQIIPDFPVILSDLFIKIEAGAAFNPRTSSQARSKKLLKIFSNYFE